MWPRSSLVVDDLELVVVVVIVVVELGGDQLLELDEQAVVAAVVAEPDRPEHERLLAGVAHVDRAGHRPALGRREVAEHPPQVLGDGPHLLLLALDADALGAGPGVEVEHPRAGLADRRWP